MDHEHSHDKQEINIEVSAEKIVARLRNRVAALQNQVDVLEIAYEDRIQENSHLVQRIAELEDQLGVTSL